MYGWGRGCTRGRGELERPTPKLQCRRLIVTFPTEVVSRAAYALGPL